MQFNSLVVTPILEKAKGTEAAKKELAELLAKAAEEAKKEGAQVGVVGSLRDCGGATAAALVGMPPGR